jgi:F-type H+-transporting ATPase subunit alpha
VNKGIRPAVDVGLSVSRVGGSAQTSPMKKTASKIKLSLAQYRELESFAQFDSDLDEDTKRTIEHGKRSVELLKQRDGEPLSVALQTLSFFALNEGFFAKYAVKDVKKTEEELHSFFLNGYRELSDEVNAGKWNDEIITKMKEVLSNFA